MQVLVSGKHVAVGEALRERVSDEITGSIGKYFDRGGNADVVVSREGHSFRVDCAVKLASGQALQSHGLGSDAHGAFDAALAQSQAIDIAVAVNRRHDDGIRTSFDGGINIFILADHHAQIDYAKIMGSKNAVQDFVAYCMAVSTNDANNKC